jgi:hypothetical protein
VANCADLNRTIKNKINFEGDQNELLLYSSVMTLVLIVSSTFLSFWRILANYITSGKQLDAIVMVSNAQRANSATDIVPLFVTVCVTKPKERFATVRS